MRELIDVFRMSELEPKVRAKLIIRLGELINNEYASNVTEAIVYELVEILDPTNDILNDEHYKKAAGRWDGF